MAVIKQYTVYEVGDVFEDFGTKIILVAKDDYIKNQKYKYIIRECLPDELVHWGVNDENYFHNLKYVEHIELKKN